MRILSNKKDYYDSAASYGIDKSHTFVRQIGDEYSETVNTYGIFSMWYPSTKYGNTSSATKKSPNYEPFILGFCGKLYIGWKIWWYVKSYGSMHEKEVFKITYKKEDIKKVISNEYKRNRYKSLDYELRRLNRFYQDVNELDLPEIFHDEQVPYFVSKITHITRKRRRSDKEAGIQSIIHTPLLKDYRVATLFDPVTAFQEIDMFLFGVLGINEKEITEVDEKYRMESRGMDKTSFRQLAPGERKERRKLNKQRKRNKKKTK